MEMQNENAAGARPFLQMREKRKFNWLVLALLLAVIVAGAALLLM